jgi:PHD/YefM family antitoxin component YafN of YafNO toxin-antitoxin module
LKEIRDKEDEMTRTIGLKEAEMDFERLAEEIWRSKDRLFIEKDGLPIAVLISIDDFEDMLETIGELSDPEYLASIREARAEYQRSEVDTPEDLYKIAEGPE